MLELSVNPPAKCVLIADRSWTVRRSLRKLFEEEGWRVCAEAVDGQEAIGKALASRPAVIVIDLSMPGMSGIVTARILRETIPESRLILFSSIVDLLSTEELCRSGFSAAINKSKPGTLIVAAQNLVDAA
jgi:DNA-binding NarL/FixJ family response regulator